MVSLLDLVFVGYRTNMMSTHSPEYSRATAAAANSEAIFGPERSSDAGALDEGVGLCREVRPHEHNLRGEHAPDRVTLCANGTSDGYNEACCKTRRIEGGGERP